MAEHAGRERTRNLQPMSHIEEPRSLLNPDVGDFNINTDIAFWGKHAFQGNWDGFTIRDTTTTWYPSRVGATSW
jgi:hypothetical protein